MKIGSRTLIVTLLVTFTILSAPAVLSQPRTDQTKLASANGTGTIKLGREEFKLTSVLVKLLDNGQAEVTLVSEITIFLNGKWSSVPGQPHNFNLTISGGSSGGALDGTGTVNLNDDDKSVTRLSIKGTGRLSKKSIEITFQGQ
ncbi:MAG: hypothetical protein C5B55_10910 [Blastocatellia bacterium]|nr:MAG: hypothetical protein C5B55_10910 [Blastocatellia bacterium]